MTYEQLNASQRRAIDAWWYEDIVLTSGRIVCKEEYYEFPDNLRYAVPGDKKQEKMYKFLYNHGCCGYCDVVLTCDDGSKLMYGFNYGH